MSAVTLAVLRDARAAALRRDTLGAFAAYIDAVSKAPRLVLVGHHLDTARWYVRLALEALTRREPRT